MLKNRSDWNRVHIWSRKCIFSQRCSLLNNLRRLWWIFGKLPTNWCSWLNCETGFPMKNKVFFSLKICQLFCIDIDPYPHYKKSINHWTSKAILKSHNWWWWGPRPPCINSPKLSNNWRAICLYPILGKLSGFSLSMLQRLGAAVSHFETFLGPLGTPLSISLSVCPSARKI